MEIIKNFGIEPFLLVAQIVNFLIVFFILKKFLYKPILGMLKKREATIKEGIQKSEEINIRLAKALEEEKTILRNAQEHAKSILESARLEIQEDTKESEEKAKKLTEKMILDARQQMAFDAKETERRLTVNIGNIAIQFLEKSLKDVLSEKEQKEIIKKTVEKLKVK